MKNLVIRLACVIPLIFILCGSIIAQTADFSALIAQVPSLLDSTEPESNLRFSQPSAALLTIFGVLALVFPLLFFRLYRNKRLLAQSLADHIDLLGAQNKQLEDNNAFHQKLISIISHDLRQPLSSMLLLGEGNMIGQMSDAQREYVFNQISQNARASLQAMDGLVHWMKLNTVGLAYTPSLVNLKENMLSALDYNRPVANQKGIAVIDFVPESIDLLAQSEMLLFVNRNILSNALRHTPDGGKIVVTADQDEGGDYAVVRIMDSGEGIAEDVLVNLFAKERSESAFGGSGLALIICHEMIEKMNGRIWAANNEQGGACICYSLPLVQANEDAWAIDSGTFPLKFS